MSTLPNPRSHKKERRSFDDTDNDRRAQPRGMSGSTGRPSTYTFTRSEVTRPALSPDSVEAEQSRLEDLPPSKMPKGQ
ncbi:hypothetical protein ACJ72_05263 [Emergomyces africanus]|uniref:Uncharacterized protein n=1 Tax=Emergomyces africanus TaxID=1955775 RepID=A0A1B7NUE0_9EURO|nr:hypothetical protein ACJ72_05263 [Emergomyces africanus]